MKILVTGASGLLGNNIVRQLLQRGDSVRVLVRSTSRSETMEGLNVESAIGDVRDAAAVRTAVAGVDAVVHAAALVHIGHLQRADSFAVNVDGTSNIIAAAAAQKASLVYVSTVDTLGAAESADHPISETMEGRRKPSCSYVDSKIAAEQRVREAMENGLPAVIVHPGFMLGPWDWSPSSGRLLLEVHRMQPLFAPSGGLSVCDVREVAGSIIRLCEALPAGERFILAGTNVSLMQCWRKIAQLTQRRGPLFPMGPIARWVVGTTGDFWSKFRPEEAAFNSAAIRMAMQRNYYDSRKAIDQLGYRIPPLGNCIVDAWNWLGRHGYHDQPLVGYDAEQRETPSRVVNLDEGVQ